MTKSLKIPKGLSEAVNRRTDNTIDQKLEDTKGVIKVGNRQHNDQKLEDTKGVIRSRKSKNRQHNDQKLEHTKGFQKS